MFLRFETPLTALWLLTDRRDAARVEPHGPGWTERWVRLSPGRAMDYLTDRRDRYGTVETARTALTREGLGEAHSLDDDAVLDAAAKRLAVGWAVEIDRIVPEGGWSDPDPPPPAPVPEAIEPEENPTGVPAKKEKDHFIVVELVGEDGDPIPDELCRITTPGGEVVEQKTDSQGRVTLEGIEEGDCDIEFPNLDQDAWTPDGSS